MKHGTQIIEGDLIKVNKCHLDVINNSDIMNDIQIISEDSNKGYGYKLIHVTKDNIDKIKCVFNSFDLVIPIIGHKSIINANLEDKVAEIFSNLGITKEMLKENRLKGD